MNELTILGDSIRDTLIRLRDKQAFLHQHQNYYLQVKSRLFELSAKSKNDGDVEEKIAENGLEFNDIIISTKGRIFVNIGYEYFVEKNKEEAIAFADEKLKLISQAIVQFTNKIREAESTENNIRELITKGDDSEDGFEEKEEGLPTIEIREELDHDDNVISSSIRPTKNHKNEKDDNRLTDFEKNLRGKLISKKEEKMRDSDSSPQIDIDDVYTFEDLVKEMDERDKMEDQLGEDEYLQSEGEEEEDADSSIIPGSQARSAFMEEIRRLRRGRLPPPKSILRSKGEKVKSKKSVGFAETAAIHEVENLKDVNKATTHDPLQIDDDGTILTKTEFDGDLFAKLIGAQGPDEIHEKYVEDLETREEQEIERIRSKKNVSKFKLERKGYSKRPVSNIVERDVEADEPVSDIVERDVEADEPVSDIIERDEPVSDIVERDVEASEPVSDIIERDEPVSDIVERDVEADEPVSDIIERDEPVSDIVERDVEASEPVSDIVEADEPVSDIIERDLESHTFSSNDETPSETTTANGSDIAGIHANNEPKLQQSRSEKKLVHKKPFKSLCKPERKIKPQRRHPHLTDDGPDKKQSETMNFPPQIQKAITPPQTVFTPKVDYRALGENLDSMARAYTLGAYDDDLHQDPGILVEKLEDFKNYNEQVGRLQNSLKEFQLNNSIQDQIDIDDQNAPLMTDVVENDLPANYDDQYDEDEDLALHPDRLQESVALDYRRLKDSLMQSRFVRDLSEKDKEIEPIDEQGNPIKQSRFRSRGLGFRD